MVDDTEMLDEEMSEEEIEELKRKMCGILKPRRLTQEEIEKRMAYMISFGGRQTMMQVKYFGFFKGMKYGKCEEDFDFYKSIKNHLNKADVLAYLKNLPITGICPMSVEDIFSGEAIEQAGIIEDGKFVFPLDFIHYYEKYDIGIPVEYEEYIESRL